MLLANMGHKLARFGPIMMNLGHMLANLISPLLLRAFDMQRSHRMRYSRKRPRPQGSVEHLLRAGPRRPWAQTLWVPYGGALLISPMAGQAVATP